MSSTADHRIPKKPRPPATTVDEIVRRLTYESRLVKPLSSHYVSLHADRATRDFLSECLRKYGGWTLRNIATTAMRRVLGAFMSHTDVIGYLGW